MNSNLPIYLLCTSVLVLSACTVDTDQDIQDYLSRLENVLEQEPKYSKSDDDIGPHKLPKRRDMKLIESSDDLTIKEFLSLRACRLHSVLAKKNSLIGKVALPSQELFLQLAILDSGPECVSDLNANQQNQLATKLDNYLFSKRKTIMIYAWRAVLGSTENEKFWANNTQPTTYPKQLNQEITQDLNLLTEFIDKIKDNDFELSLAEESALEDTLSRLRFGDGGHLLFELSVLSNGLGQANQLISQATAKPFCLQNRATTQAHYFRNVITKLFIEKIQRRAVQLNQRYQQLMPAYLTMESKLLAVAPKAYQEWVNSRQADFAHYRSASKRHVALIQALLKQCGLEARS